MKALELCFENFSNVGSTSGAIEEAYYHQVLDIHLDAMTEALDRLLRASTLKMILAWPSGTAMICQSAHWTRYNAFVAAAACHCKQMLHKTWLGVCHAGDVLHEVHHDAQ